MNNLIVAITVFLLTPYFNDGQNKGSYIIATSELNGLYQLVAIFNENISYQVLDCVNKCLIQDKDKFLKKVNQNTSIKLDDETIFSLKLLPGELRIKFKKTQNSGARYDSLIMKCEILKEKINVASGCKT